LVVRMLRKIPVMQLQPMCGADGEALGLLMSVSCASLAYGYIATAHCGAGEVKKHLYVVHFFTFCMFSVILGVLWQKICLALKNRVLQFAKNAKKQF